MFSVAFEFVCLSVRINTSENVRVTSGGDDLLHKHPPHCGKLQAVQTLKQNWRFKKKKNTLHRKQCTFAEAFPVMRGFFPLLDENESVQICAGKTVFGGSFIMSFISLSGSMADRRSHFTFQLL